MGYVYPEHDARLAGVRRLVWAEAAKRLIASCEASRRLVTLDISAPDALPIAGATEVLDAKPGAVAVDDTYIYALVGESLRKFTNAAVPVEVASVPRGDDNNAWIDLVGDDFIIFADGVDVVIARRDTLATVSRVTSLVGRVRIGIYDPYAHSPTAYVFGERTGCIVFVVSSAGGTLMAVEEALQPNAEGITGLGCDSGELILASETGRIQFWFFHRPTEDPFLDLEHTFDVPVRSIGQVTDNSFYYVFSQSDRPSWSTDRFDMSPEVFAMYAMGRCFRAYENGRVSSESRFQAIDYDNEIVTIAPAEVVQIPEAETTGNGYPNVTAGVRYRLASRPVVSNRIEFVPQAGMTFVSDDINNGSMVFDTDTWHDFQWHMLKFDSIGTKTVQFYAVSFLGEVVSEIQSVEYDIVDAPGSAPAFSNISGSTDLEASEVGAFSVDVTYTGSTGTCSYAWSVVSQPALSVVTGIPASGNLGASVATRTLAPTFSLDGEYVIRFSATDTYNRTTHHDFTIEVAEASPPSLSSISGFLTPTHGVSSNYSANCTYHRPGCTYSWSKVSGPGTVTFTPASGSCGPSVAAVVAGVVFSATGLYEIQLDVVQDDAQTATVTKDSILAV